MAAVLMGILALNAGPAMADEFDEFFIEDEFLVDDGFFGDEVLFVDEGTATYDELCSPFLPEGFFIPGCIFSDPLEEEVVFFEEDIDFDDEEVVFLLDEDIDFDDEEVVFLLDGDIDFDEDDFDFEDEDIFDDDDDDDNEQSFTRIIDR